MAAATLLRRFHPKGAVNGLGIQGAVPISGVYNVQLEKLARGQLDIATLSYDQCSSFCALNTEVSSNIVAAGEEGLVPLSTLGQWYQASD